MEKSENMRLNSHLWAIYHNDFNNLKVVHKLEDKLDTGKIYKIKKFYYIKILNYIN